MASFKISNYRPFRLVLDDVGPHRFGGAPFHSGVIPKNCDVPLHLVLTLDLHDPLCPFECDPLVRFLPLYYPFKYGFGGPEVQYAVLSDTEIELLYMNDKEPDAPEQQYVQVSEFPSSRASLVPLEYEEARIRAFVGNGYFQSNTDDRTILERLDYNNLVDVGGHHRILQGDKDIVCKNPSCKFFNRRVWHDRIAMIPCGLPVRGESDFWYEYDGGADILFFLCRYCGTVIAFNKAS
jgi:hypothetical protein